MKEIEDIFSNKKSKKEEIKTKVVVDNRERNSLVLYHLIENKIKIELKNLDIGDYLIKDIVIERKTFSDFQSSIIDKRFQNQLENLKKIKRKILLVEGFDDYKNSRINENALRGALLSVALTYNVPLIFTKNEEDSAKFLILIAKKEEKNKTELSLRMKKATNSLEEQKQFILEGFPGIGPTKAKELLKNYKNLLAIFKAKEKKLEKILDKKTIEKMKEILEG
ncbi:MAG: ERCC4 domain-containing protein [Candidatus Pacearchaeota archaeon]